MERGGGWEMLSLITLIHDLTSLEAVGSTLLH